MVVGRARIQPIALALAEKQLVSEWRELSAVLQNPEWWPYCKVGLHSDTHCGDVWGGFSG